MEDILVNRLHAAGKIKKKHEDKDFFTRMIHVNKEFHGASVLMHKLGILPEVSGSEAGEGGEGKEEKEREEEEEEGGRIWIYFSSEFIKFSLDLGYFIHNSLRQQPISITGLPGACS